MALVIFCVALTEAMRLRSSFSDGIAHSWQAGAVRLAGVRYRTRRRSVRGARRCERLPARSRASAFRQDRRRATAYSSDRIGRRRNASRKRLGELVDGGLELVARLLGDFPLVADSVQNAGMLGAHIPQQLVLEASDRRDRHGIEIAVDAGIDHDHLLL